ncbi:unnamed protein product, partial [Ectocarpus fasciculatus]
RNQPKLIKAGWGYPRPFFPRTNKRVTQHIASNPSTVYLRCCVRQTLRPPSEVVSAHWETLNFDEATRYRLCLWTPKDISISSPSVGARHISVGLRAAIGVGRLPKCSLQRQGKDAANTH